jgi:hypothetical protein
MGVVFANQNSGTQGQYEEHHKSRMDWTEVKCNAESEDTNQLVKTHSYWLTLKTIKDTVDFRLYRIRPLVIILS